MEVRPIDGNALIEWFSPYLHTGEAITPDVVIEDIRSMPTLAPPNEPLTLEQLREMDGEPVYLMPMKWWALVESPKGLKRVILRLSNGGWAALYSDEDLKYYTEAIYCRPPEGEEDTCREIPCDWPCGEGPVSEAN